ncbi:ATP-binding protein [Agathobaculum sp.]|uniref:ATP-binding protein n=1 Tax=Agathobaculum sp. TaxID=2048138 RepID=UPI003AB3364F
MNIVLKSLDLVHFKCFPKLHLDFHEGVNNIYGENAAGKTSVYDSLTWLLFNKDSAGNARPDIKPHGAPQGTMPEVTAILIVDGEPIKLRKVLREKWEKPRGSSVERYAGDTRDYYIDDVPLAENEYKRRIAELIDETRFKLLTDVWAVTSKMHWKDRRTLLAEICGLPEDKQLLATAPQFAELNEKVGRRTVDEFKAVLAKQRKDMNANLNTLPVRVDECSRMVSELESLDFAAAHAESDRLQTERERMQGEIVKLSNNTLAAQARNERDALKNQLSELEVENNAHLASQRAPIEDETPALTAALDRAKHEADRLTRTIAQETDYIASGETRLNYYRARWRAIDAEPFTADRCPTCGQVFPAERLAAARQSFEDGKNRRKNELLEDSNLLKTQISAAKDRLLTAETALKTAQDEVQKAQIALDSYTPPVEVVPENLPDYDRRKGAILTLIADAEKRLDRVSSDTEQERRRLETALSAVTTEKLTHDAVLAKEQTLADTRRRIADLQAEQRTAAAEVEQMDRLIAMCEEFTRYRVQAITESVNSRFRLTRWQLFTEQVNGGLADCCEPMDSNGTAFEGTNNAMKINIGMDIIDTLSEFYGVRVPLFVDNAESVTHLQEIGSQVVRLVVSEQDKELRIE